VAFHHFGLMVLQVQLARQQRAVPLTRDYLAEAESRLRALDRANRTCLRLAGE
jgi:cyclopropane-fatty-acyl-phospholipid synthase